MKTDLQLEIREKIAFVTINRPEKLNALRLQTVTELEETFDFLHQQDIQVVIVKGSGDKAFVAGADISEFVTVDGKIARKISEDGNRVFAKIEQFKVPVIMAINGYALGGGLELALAGHLRIASENAVLGLPEVSLGLFPGYGGTQRLPSLVGKAKAMELIFTAERISAQEAVRIGLVNSVVTLENLMPTCLTLAEKIKKNSTKAISCSIKAILASGSEVGFNTEITQFEKCFEGDISDFQQRVQQFLQRTKA